ncbi:tol-pal system YbgF family protein [Flavobacterium sp. J27]|uniref:tetratricopeptide repeat protein n=1 Tax=Flavobacterium sp. J27 TaxID=2060419 RepID=UPI001031A4DA|nr:hypothetical protein [Flavobacterium sp. J27]
MDTFDLIDQYLKGTLSEAEKIAFENRMQEDQNLKEEVLIQKQLFASHDFNTKEVENDWYTSELQLVKEKLKSDENKKLSDKIKRIGLEHTVPTLVTKKKRQPRFIYAIAATIAVTITTLMLFFNKTSLPNYYEKEVNWNELPSFTVKSDVETTISEGEKQFREKKYKQAIKSFETIAPNDKWYPYALLYIGASYDQLNENENAIATFQKIAQLSDFMEHSKGYWYQLLLYLKTNDKANALEMKKIILENPSNYKYQETKELDF